MIGRFLALLRKDIVNAYRNYFFLATIFIAVLFALIINFVVPKEASLKPTMYLYNNYDSEYNGILNDIIKESRENHDGIIIMNSREEIVENMKENYNSLGMTINEVNGKPSIEFIMQGHENERLINILLLSMRDGINKRISGDFDLEVINIRGDSKVEDIPLNKSVLPTFLVMEPALLGFVMIAALIFMEKEEGTIRSYMVSPGRLPEYLASKITLMVILGWLSTLISTILVVGLNANFFNLLLIVTLGGIFASGLGLIVASFFDNLSKSIVWIMAISLMLSLPFISYFMPSFAPIYVRVMPTYPLLFAIREAVFPTGNDSLIYTTALTFLILSTINYILSIITYRYNLSKS